MTAAKLATLLMLALSPLGSGMAAEVEEAPEVIVVTGPLPGPPLWKVSNGDKVLWIFPYLNWIPKDMSWESERVERVIAGSQEALSLPRSGLKPSPLLLLNPINVARGVRLMKRIERNPDGGALEENLSPELYARFAALQALYFPRNPSLVEMRPGMAGQTMMSIIRSREGLISGNNIQKTIRRLVRRNRDIKRTETSVVVELEGGFGDFADRMETLWETIPPEQEQACFEQQVRHMEEDIDAMKSRANTWAQGYIDEFRNVPLVYDEEKTCNYLFMGSSEQKTLVDIATREDQMWLDAADNALATNASTFAILPINELLSEDGLLSRLKAKGYEISEP